MIIIVIALFFLMLYVFSLEETPKAKKIEDTPIEDDKMFYLKTKKGLYIDKNLSLNPTEKHLFKINLLENKEYQEVLLQSKGCGYISIVYTPINKAFYKVKCDDLDSENMSNCLTLKKRKDYFYIKFYTDHFLCVDEDGVLIASKNKKSVVFFKLEKPF